MDTQQKGFTLIELVVVILVLSVLAATALPRFMNVQDKAHYAAVAGVAGGFGSASAMVRAQWMANGGTVAVNNVTGFGDGLVNVNSFGWPVGVTGTVSTLATNTHCAEIWHGIMQNPPTTNPNKLGVADTTADYTAVVNTTTNTCTYSYNGDSSSRSLEYNEVDGSLTVTNPKG